MRTLSEFYDGVLTFCALLTGVILVGIAFVIVIEVIARNALGVAFPWLLEGSEYAFYFAVFLAVPWCLRQNAHVRVDVLLMVSGPRSSQFISIGAETIGLVVALILCYCGIVATLDSIDTQTIIYKSIVFPEWWVLTVFPVSMSFLAVEFVLRLRAVLTDQSRRGA